VKIPGCDFQIRADIIHQSTLRRVKLGKSHTKTGSRNGNQVGILETKGPSFSNIALHRLVCFKLPFAMVQATTDDPTLEIIL
jgi:hypothetical protein